MIKICSKCKLEKKTTEFSLDKTKKDGYCSECNMTTKLKTADELWTMIEQLAKDEAIIYQAFQLQRIGKFNREYTAIALALALLEELRIVRSAYLTHTQQCTMPPGLVEIEVYPDKSNDGNSLAEEID